MNCFFCGREIETRERVGFRDTCPGCDRPLHACRNCDFYDWTYHNQCRETQADRVVDKERANFCEYFTPSQRRAAAAGPATKSSAVGKLEDLFKKKP
ncbi:MAG TPA: hypothetical protein VGI36_08350 [Candidatus Binataceae bacterium]|jgi:hypothetical protein